MKKIVTLAIALSMGLGAIAQKIKIKESNESIGGGSHNALTVTLYEISPSDAEDAFRSFMKKYDGKRSSKDGAIFVDHATIKDMGNNTIDIYGKAQGKKGDPEITFVVAFDLGGAFLNSGDHKEQYKIAEKIVKEFAVQATKDAIQEKLKAAQKVQSNFEDEQKSLEKENKNLNDDIADYKAKITKAEQDIAKNKTDQDKKKAEIEAQKKVVGEIDKKLQAVE
ncbi:MAG: laminin subunit beta [Bacteroidetes bacterium]|nr:laminin subunit beta [Bacteroidota bacterium]